MKETSVRVYSNSSMKDKINRKASQLGLSASAYLLTLAEKDTRHDTKQSRIMQTVRFAQIDKRQNELEQNIAKIKQAFADAKELRKAGIKPEDYVGDKLINRHESPGNKKK